MKCRKIAAIIREIQMYQNQPYHLQIEPSIRVSDFELLKYFMKNFFFGFFY